MPKRFLLFLFLIFLFLTNPQVSLARDPYPNKPNIHYQLISAAEGANPKTMLKSNGQRSEIISFACAGFTTKPFSRYLSDPQIDSLEKATEACTQLHPGYAKIDIPYLKNNKQDGQCAGKEYNANCYDSPIGTDFVGSTNIPTSSLFSWVTPIVYSAQEGRPSLCGPNRDQLCGSDCIYTPLGPKETFVTLKWNKNGVKQECVAPPYTTSGPWWNWLIKEFDKYKNGASVNTLISVGIFFGIDGESRPVKSDTGWTAEGIDIGKRFYEEYLPAVVREIKNRYPNKVIRAHSDSGLFPYMLNNGIELHRESLNSDAYGSYSYMGLPPLGFWQGFANYFWITNSQGLQGWKPMYQTALAGLSQHTYLITGIILEGLYENGRGDFLKFISEYIGRNINDTPGVWTHLRETIHKKEGKEQSGKYGDYDYYLYRLEDLEGNKTVPVLTEELPIGTKNQIYNYNLPWVRWQIPTDNLYVGRKNAPGNNYMSFDIDDGYRYTGKTNLSYDVRIVYLDTGNDSFKFQYKNSSNQWKEKPITKTNTNLWKEIKFTITDAFFNNNASVGSNASTYPSDFRIETNGSTISLVEIRGLGNISENQRLKAQVSCDIVENESDDPKEGVYSLGLNRNIKVKSRLIDQNGKAIPNERIMFAYNTEWSLAKSAKTDQNGISFSPLSTANRLDSSGFVGSYPGRDDKDSSYSVSVYYQGGRQYQPSRNDCTLRLTSSTGKTDPKNLRMKITNIDSSQVSSTGKVNVSYEIYGIQNNKIASETRPFGKSEGFVAEDPNSQTFTASWFKDGYQWTSNNITLIGSSTFSTEPPYPTSPPTQPPSGTVAGDTNSNGCVGARDLGFVMGHYQTSSQCPPSSPHPTPGPAANGDFNHDNCVDDLDLSVVSSKFSYNCNE